MNQQLEIQPRELKFAVELNKQSKCSIRLVNKSDQYVAFKVKTTSPKKYCVRPNVGVVLPNATYEFVVIMQAPKELPADLTCKDKFLVQNTVVPDGTSDENITSEMFSRDNERYIEERKLRVTLSIPPTPQSLESAYVNGTQEQANGHVEANSKTVNDEDLKLAKDSEVVPIYNVKFEPIKNVKPFEGGDSNIAKDVESNNERTTTNIAEVQAIKSRVPVGEDEQRLFKEVEEMKFKLQELESKLNKTEVTASKLTEERRLAIQERESLQQEMATLRKRKVERRVQDGFPLLFVCMVAFISLVVGYGFHP